MFIVHLTQGPSVQIDSNELEYFIKNSKKDFIVFKQGVINPSRVVSITPDKEREKQTRHLANGKVEAPPPLQDAFSFIKQTNTPTLHGRDKRS